MVHAWFEVFVDGYFAAPLPYERDVIEQGAQELLEKIVASIPDGSPWLDVEGVLLHGQPEVVLLHEAADADLMVVGSRGRGRASRAVLGSVSQRVVQHAPCPVVVIR